MIGEIPQGLDSARRRAGADRHQVFRVAANLPDALGIVGCRDRALDQGHVVRARLDPAGRFEKIRNLHSAGELQQLVLEAQDRQLTSVAGGEFVDGQRRLGRTLEALDP